MRLKPNLLFAWLSDVSKLVPFPNLGFLHAFLKKLMEAGDLLILLEHQKKKCGKFGYVRERV